MWYKSDQTIEIILNTQGAAFMPSIILRVLLVSTLFFFYGCGNEPGHEVVDFSKTVQIERPAENPASPSRLRVSVAAMISPKETFEYYQRLLDYIGEKMGRQVQLIQRKTYGEINELAGKGEIDLAFICSGPYAFGQKKYGFEALAVPLVRSQPFYQSYLIVNRQSPYQTLRDLKDKTFAFTDPNSNTGRFVPTYWLSQINEKPETFFSDINYTYGHDNSILAVARSLVDGAAVDSHIWEYFDHTNNIHTSQTRIIRKSDNFGSPPLVASKSLTTQQKKSIREIVLSMHHNAKGRAILQELMIDRFVPPKEEWYEPIQEMLQTVRPLDQISHANS